MLFEASDTCAPACPALHTVRFSFLFHHLFLVPRFLFLARDPTSSSSRETPQRTLPPGNRVYVEAHASNVCTVTYGVSCIKMQTMIRTTLRSHAPTIHSPADVWTAVVYRSSRAASTRWSFLSLASKRKVSFRWERPPRFQRIDYGSATKIVVNTFCHFDFYPYAPFIDVFINITY